jgi:pimeloyl-ACP methyl ester carboxylesterase
MAVMTFDRFWHKTLKRPYYLARPINRGRGNETVILLHGIGRTSKVWQHVLPGLKVKNLKVVAFDLLGFGRSPKPKWIDYSVDNHADAVIASITRLNPKQPVIIVGHSMGCLVAVRVALRRPDLVKHLVLFEMPLYEGLPHKRSYRLRTDLYYRIYRRIIKMKPTFTNETARMVERLGRKIAGQELTRETWQPFVKSLENTIMKQTTADDIKKLSIPMDVIYGRFDMLVIRGKPKQVFGVDNEKIATHTIRGGHVITPKASQFLVSRILAARETE